MFKKSCPILYRESLYKNKLIEHTAQNIEKCPFCLKLRREGLHALVKYLVHSVSLKLSGGRGGGNVPPPNSHKIHMLLKKTC